MRRSGATTTTSLRLAPLAALLGATSAVLAAEIPLQPGDSIQAAIDDPLTQDGDELVLAPGTYVETIDLRGRALVIRSQAPHDPAVVAATILDGGGAGTVVTAWSGETAATVLDGLTITGGHGFSGGGMYIDSAGPTVRRCVFVANSAVFDGGGLMALLGAPLITHCRFVGNDAQYGGGIALLDGAPMVVNCSFSGNVASASGGGVDLLFADGAAILGCTFSGNVGGRGGAIACDTSSPTVANSVLSGDAALVSGDEVSAIYGSQPSFAHCLVAGSGGSGAWDPTLGVDLGGNLDGDPRFADAAGPDGVRGTLDDDLALLAGSPCLDAGDDERVPSDASDLDGDGDVLEPLPLDLRGGARFLDDPEAAGGGGMLVDMGAHEHVPPPAASCLGDLDADGGIDVADLVMLVQSWGPCGGCAADLDGSGGVDFADLLTLLSRWGSCESGAQTDAPRSKSRKKGATSRGPKSKR